MQFLSTNKKILPDRNWNRTEIRLEKEQETIKIKFLSMELKFFLNCNLNFLFKYNMFIYLQDFERGEPDINIIPTKINQKEKFLLIEIEQVEAEIEQIFTLTFETGEGNKQISF